MFLSEVTSACSSSLWDEWSKRHNPFPRGLYHPWDFWGEAHGSPYTFSQWKAPPMFPTFTRPMHTLGPKMVKFLAHLWGVKASNRLADFITKTEVRPANDSVIKLKQWLTNCGWLEGRKAIYLADKLMKPTEKPGQPDTSLKGTQTSKPKVVKAMPSCPLGTDMAMTPLAALARELREGNLYVLAEGRLVECEWAH